MLKKIIICACLLGIHPVQSFGLSEHIEGSANILDAYVVTVKPPIEVFVILPQGATGGTLTWLSEKKFHTESGSLLLILSAVEQAYFKDGRLVRYQYMVSEDKKQRARTSILSNFATSTGNKRYMEFFDIEFLGHWLSAAEKKSNIFTIEKIDGKNFSMKYEQKTKTYSFVIGGNN